ncbi:MAG: LPS-assembly protein LptD [Deltaproteobacteria bacterium]|nr:LPS-assembly protein LptD [Deltaproteobacteria bacterium]
MLILLLVLFPSALVAQSGVQPPTRKFLFERDDPAYQKLQKRVRDKAVKPDVPARSDLDFKSPKVEFNKEENVVTGSGGVVISQSGMQAQADKARVDMNTKDAHLEGDVLISTGSASVSAEESNFNLDSETGTFVDSEMYLEDGGFRILSEEARKISEFKYNLDEASLTTCSCPDQYRSWNIHSGEANITQEGYAHCYNNWLDFHGVPFFYVPYMAFPVKQERQSGLLVPEWGYSSEDGVQFKQPLFVVIDDSLDFTLTPFIENQTRYGSALDYNQSFSEHNNATGRILYSNERPRDGNLRGTITTGVFDPSIDDDRLGGFYYHVWRSDPRSEVPISFISDIHLVSDDLFVREIEDEFIAEPSARYLTSVMLLRTQLTDEILAELGGEYNQYIDSDDDLGFQRLPELNVSGSHTLRPFGANPYGIKLVPRATMTVTDFVRQEGFDGVRSDLFPTISMPFRYKNYIANEATVGIRQTNYNLNETVIPGSTVELDSSSDRTLAYFGYSTSTAIERVFELEDDNWLTYVTSLGAKNQDLKLTRLKHTLEPFITYLYVPPTAQGDLPFFDSQDRIEQTSAFIYGFRTSLYGRMLPPSGADQPITELTPRIEELPTVGTVGALPDLGSIDGLDTFGSGAGKISSRVGEIREIAALTLKQAYNYVEEHKNFDPNIGPFSDVTGELSLFPTSSFAFVFQENFDVENADFSSWSVGTHFIDDRGDSFKARYSYRENSTSQIQGNLELAISEQLRLGYYAFFDDRESEFIENSVAARIISACNCWHLDVGYSDRINPDKQQVFLRFTFTGLGDITQDIGLEHLQRKE